jgi:hypothetical protein
MHCRSAYIHGGVVRFAEKNAIKATMQKKAAVRRRRGTNAKVNQKPSTVSAFFSFPHSEPSHP